ncbi:YqiA/YcfP family alpha/beta fold hydrolase [Alteromonas halophila]|uniref:Esterase YqiA n=1 Tax=Alteromonas halophila TaxID=516698 RepID=A0A918JIC4_9ALTE|nr:YqiA/YcfP family alpha/beta fold hydrolase [Alteromonas halophila]GGW80182.1 esterase YqiA [Alteromonas halophila]
MTEILYLHGFLSSELSVKAVATQQFFASHYPHVNLQVPRLTNYPSQVQDQLETLIAARPALTDGGLRVIGSSMGGFLATYLVEKYGGRAVLINPAVRPYALLQDYLGQHQNPYTRQDFELVASDIEALVALDTPAVRQPSHYRVLLQTGDETLDYREAQNKYAGSSLVIEQGGDHSFTSYTSHLPEIADFLLARDAVIAAPENP